MPGSRWSCWRCRRRSSSGGSSSAGRRATSARARAESCRPARPWPCPRGASARATRVLAMIVREPELDLDAFEGPFDLLLTLVLKEEVDLADVDVAGIVVRFVERLAERETLDLDACGEFLVLVAALLELKARGLFEDEAAELADLEPEEAAEELARRLAEYRRMKEAAGSRAEQAIAFLALLELRRANQISISQAAPFAPIRVSRVEEESAAVNERTDAWNVRSA